MSTTAAIRADIAPITSGTGFAIKNPKDKKYAAIFKTYMLVIGMPPTTHFSDFRCPRYKARQRIKWRLSSKSIIENQLRVAGLVLLSLKFFGLKKTIKLIMVMMRAYTKGTKATLMSCFYRISFFILFIIILN